MDDETMHRLGGNEAAFRKLNEALRANKGPADSGQLFPFRCECGVLGCNRLMELSLPEYEAVRAKPTTFAIIDGHEIPETEYVRERYARYSVVEKHDEAAEVPAATDPRS